MNPRPDGPPIRPAVSVVLPVHDGAATLQHAIDSIRTQTYPSWELLVVDDGSTDESPAIAQACARDDGRIRVLPLPHGGIVSALNAGLAEARGRWIARMDADDVSHPERLALQIAFLESHPEVGLVSCRITYGGDPERHAGYALHVDWLNSLVSIDDIAAARFVESPFAHPSVVFAAEIARRHGGYRDGDFPEDYELWLRWFEAGVTLAKVPEFLLRWSDPPDRLSRRDPRYRFDAFYHAKAGYLARHLMSGPASDRRCLVWGAGRLTRRRVELFEAAGLRVDGFVDVDPRKQHPRPDGRPVLAPEAVPPPAEAFVLGCVANRGAREFQRNILRARGYREGRDFLFAA